ncbi:carboxypeptidase-like regulatory domain-containing protein [Chitinophaga solisilvae]|uniref:carboxypeptidase-like regulatory domain-containing protein n=1 Tax=Chitinophaga solisilvae TaxID=1233460 RepID=UPI001367B74E|nr:carboxypeptidase-like regulatory domain-containing protein [Chitinophaga solisilvae]
MKKVFLYLLTGSMLLLAACDKRMATADNQPEIINPGTNPGGKNPLPDKPVKAGLQGIVSDENSNPLSGAQVACGGILTTTDTHGAFIIPEVTLQEAAGVITIKKSGYFDGIRTISVTGAGKLQYIQVQLLPKKAAGVFDAATGGNITASNAQFIFVPNQVLNANNQPYKGKVTLLYAPINPEHPDFADIMPGDLRAIDINNAIVGLKSYGMMALELQGENGEKLHLDGTNNVTFKLDIPATLQAGAPATIPLWHFDEAIGLWREEGSAQKIGNSYVGTVKHFSFWNVDAKFPVVKFKAVFQDDKGVPYPNIKVTITRSQEISSSYGFTDEAGMVSGDIPSHEELTITIEDKCKDIIFTRKIGPFSTDANIGKITIARGQQLTLALHGKIISCSGAPVKTGVVNISVEGISYRAPIINGNYSVAAPRCSNNNAVEVIINAVDEGANKMSTIRQQLAPGDYTRDMQACNNIQPGEIKLLLEGKAYEFNTISDSIRFRTSNDSSTRYQITFSKAQPSLNKGSWVFYTIGLGSNNYSTLNLNVDGVAYYGSLNTEVTATGGPGEYLEGSLFGNVYNYSTQAQVPISGNFRIRIE